MKADIMFGILLELIEKDKVTAQELADKFEVSKKTIYRYLSQMDTAGVPTITCQGRHGGISLFGKIKLSSMYFSKEDLETIGTMATSLSPVLGVNLQSTFSKLSHTNQTYVKKEIANIGKCIQIDTAGWGQKNSIIQTELKTCAENCTKVKITYLSKEGISVRIIEPHQLIQKSGEWYVYAFCETKKSFRLFKICRITKIEKTNERFVPKENDWKREYNKSFKRERITMEVNPNILGDIANWLENTKIEKVFPLTISGNAIKNSGLVHKLLEYESQIKVIEPADLANSILESCKKIANIYQSI